MQKCDVSPITTVGADGTCDISEHRERDRAGAGLAVYLLETAEERFTRQFKG